MPQLALSLLGQVHFTLDGRPLTEFESDKARALLIYLAVEAGRPHRRAQLGALFWAEQAEKSALQNLRKTLSRLRQTLHDSSATSFLIATPQAIEFNCESDIVLDVDAFHQLIAATQHHRHRRLASCRTCAEQLARAAQLYRGNFLAGFALKDCPEFDNWAAVQRERLRLQALDALNALAAYHERRGDYTALRADAQRRLELEPWLESAHRQLMRALVHTGNRAAALAQYGACRDTLLRELGVEPEVETTALYEQIKTAEKISDFSRKSDFSLRNFPARLTSFVGREQEIRAIGEALQDPACRLLTLIGTGGSGKTRLAVEVATNEAGAFEDGACFAPLAALTSGELIASAVANALGLALLPTQDPKTQVFHFLRDKEMLLVLDNVEHLLNEANASVASFMSELMQACPRVVILATSREKLRLYGEREFQVLPLPTPRLGYEADDLAASAIARFPGVELFTQRAQAVNAAFRLDDGDATVVGEICDRLDGLPLAIELAAVRSKLFKPRELLAQLQRRLDFLNSGARDLPARQQTLWRAIAWSYDLLTSHEQALFRRLAVFSGGFTLAAAKAVCNADDVLAHLAALMDKSLIYAAHTRGESSVEDSRFDMLETLREFALHKLLEADEEERVRDAHLRFHCAFAEGNEQVWLLGELRRPLVRLEREHDNLRTALTWAYERGQFELGLRLIGALARFWRRGGHLSEGEDWSARMLATEAEAAPGAKASPAVRARALLGAAEMARIAGHGDQARSLAETSLVIYRSLNDGGGAGYALTVLGALAHYARTRDHATRLLVEAEVLFRAADDRRGLGYALLWLGDVRLRMGDLNWAARCFSEALPIFRALDDRAYVSWALGGLGDIARLEGNYDKAEAELREALSLHVGVTNKYGLPFPIEALAIVASAQKQDDRAAVLWGIAAGLRQTVAMPVPGSYQADYDPFIHEICARLGQSQFDELKAKGTAMPFERAIEFVLSGSG